MKSVIIFFFIVCCFCACSEQKQTIGFETLHTNEFNTSSFGLPNDKALDSVKYAHDSCMGFSFDANAQLVQTKDTFSIGSIVNKRTLKVVNTVNDLGLTETQLTAEFNVITNPCYETRVLHFPLKSVLGENFIFRLPGATEAMNKEINDALSASNDAEMQTGSWIYLDMKNALINILDTTKSIACLQYKKNVLDTANMVLTTVESITDVTFLISTGKDMSAPLQTLLAGKPMVALPNSKFLIKLFYIDTNKFEMTLNGFFPMIGRFMKAAMQ